jgi:hypothetical protein
MQGIKQAAEAESTCSLGQDSLVRKLPDDRTFSKITETVFASQIDPAGISKRTKFLVTMNFVGRAKTCRYWPGTPDGVYLIRLGRLAKP